MMRLTTLSLGILLSACTHYRYIDPQTSEGLDCLRKLDAKVNACESEVRDRQASYDNLYNSLSMFRQQCTMEPNACPPPPTRTQVSNYCRDDYDEKFVACGGRIEEVER